MTTAPKIAMVLAAGLGTRMRPLTDDRPKALVEVGGRALIDHMLDRLVEAGVETAVVNVHAFADQLEAHLIARQAKGLGPRINSANPKWLTHLIDFMANTENLTGSTFEIKPTDRFFIDHESLIARMNADQNEFLTRLSVRVREMEELMKEATEKEFLMKTPWIYASRTLVFDLLPGNRESVALDLCLYPSGWELQLFGRSNSSRHYALGLGDRILGGPPQRTNGGQRCLAASWPLETDLGIIREGVTGWIQKLAEAAGINEPQPAGASIQAGLPEL